MSGVRSCRICGCTDARACPGGCSWAGETLCSACVPTVDETFVGLQLVSGTDHITEDQVRGWSIDQRADAFDWAMAVHFHASDNDDVVVPLRPDFTLKAAPQEGGR
jgi:hypothetical protein